MAKRIVGALVLLLILGGFLTCKNPLHKFDNPVDPDSDNYIGVPSEDNDGDGIGQYDDVDEIVSISPENGTTVSELPLLLTVYKFNPEKVKQYWIQVSTDESFSATVVNKNDYSSNECAVSSGIIENNTSYYWRAKAYDGSKWSDNWSSTWSFTIDIAPPTTPYPSNGSTIIDLTPLLDWEDVASAAGYHIEVNTNSGFTGTVIANVDTLTASQYPITEALSDNTTYYWRVKTKSDVVWGDWSSTWSFMVDIGFDDFSTDTSGNYEGDYFCYSGTGSATLTYSVVSGKLHITNSASNCYNYSLTRRKTEYIIPAGLDFDFSVDANRRTYDSYNLGIALWNDANRTKYLEVQFSDYGDASIVRSHLEIKYNGAPTNPSDPFTVRIKREGSIYTCWVGGTQIFNGVISELDGEDLRYGVICERSSGPTGNALADYDNWNLQ